MKVKQKQNEKSVRMYVMKVHDTHILAVNVFMANQILMMMNINGLVMEAVKISIQILKSIKKTVLVIIVYMILININLGIVHERVRTLVKILTIYVNELHPQHLFVYPMTMQKR